MFDKGGKQTQFLAYFVVTIPELPLFPVHASVSILLFVLYFHLNYCNNYRRLRFINATHTMVHAKFSLKTKLRGFSTQANYTDRETAACRRS
jgi:hypothetical protein